MTAQTVRGVLLSLLIGALMAAGILVSAGLAKADTAQDYQFFALLEDAGITVTSPRNAKLAAAAICGELAAGNDWRLIVTEIMTTADFDLDTSSTIVAAAITAYCPSLAPGRGTA